MTTVNAGGGFWADVALPTAGLSHRATTSSRHPGRVFEGTVNYAIARIVECEHCHGLRRASPYPHAPRWKRVEGVYVQVDCVGMVLA